MTVKALPSLYITDHTKMASGLDYENLVITKIQMKTMKMVTKLTKKHVKEWLKISKNSVIYKCKNITYLCRKGVKVYTLVGVNIPEYAIIDNYCVDYGLDVYLEEISEAKWCFTYLATKSPYDDLPACRKYSVLMSHVDNYKKTFDL